jgi:predicted phage baseplate assembly protein
VEVIFGDGQNGSRLPSGVDNVTATYRTGLGLAGEVQAGSLSILQTRPLGIREVTNPLPASGAADPERLEEARANAPLTVLTLERIVSLRDFEDFARAFAGVGKAQAAAVWNGESRVAHLTVAAADGDPLDPDSAPYSNLVKALEGARDPLQQVIVAGYQPLHFNLGITLRIAPGRERAAVLDAARDRLLAAFSFEQRAFGQAVTAAEIVRVVQDVPGVIAADLDQFFAPSLSPLVLLLPHLASFIPAAMARWDGRRIQPAQLLTLNPSGLALNAAESRP